MIIIFYFYLDKAIDELRITKNKLAVESKIRPNTISSIVSGDISRIELPTLEAILETLNRIAVEKGINRTFDINDVIRYKQPEVGDYVRNENGYIRITPIGNNKKEPSE